MRQVRAQTSTDFGRPERHATEPSAEGIGPRADNPLEMTVTVASRVESVTVHRRGARVTRVARLARGAQRVRFEGLPLCLEDATVAAAYGGAGEARHLRVVLAVPDGDPSAPAAEDEELEAVEAEAKRLTAEAELLDSELAALAYLTPRPRQRAEREPPPASPHARRSALVALREELAAGLHARQRALAEARREVERRRESLAERRRGESSARAPASHELRKAIEIVLNAPAAAESELRVSYDVPGARWAPAYGARLDEALQGVVVELRALVAQRTGEDWSAARLRLSTADRHRRHHLPELPARRIGRAQPQPRRGWRAPPPGADALFEDYRRFVDSLPPPPPPVVARPAPPPPRAPMPARELAAAAPMGAMAPMTAPAGYGGAPRKSAGIFATRSRSVSAETSAEDDALDAPSEPTPPRYGDVDPVLLDYDRLRIAAPGEPQAGKLLPRTPEALYLESAISVSLDLRHVIAVAVEAAESLPAPPERFTLAFSEAYDHAFDAAAPVDVPSDGGYHAIAVQRAEAAIDVLHVVVPRESTDAFRTARFDNPFDAPILPGPVDVYLGRNYLTASTFGFTSLGGELRLGLGVEQGIKVARNARFREASTGLIGNALLLCHDVSIELANRTGRSLEVEVRERVPVVREADDDIKVVVRDVSPPWEVFAPFPSSAEREALRGGQRWRLRLDENGVEKLRFGYDVRIAAKHELVGGNRRET